VKEEVFIITTNDDTSERLDKYLAGKLSDYSRTKIQGFIHDGFVQLDGVAVVKPGFLITKGHSIKITVPPDEPSDLIPEDIPLDVVFENRNLLVINKKAGMVVHPAIGHPSGTLVHAALAYLPEIEGVGGKQRPGVVHRLDKDTSGLIVIAKDDKTHRWLQDQFRTRKVKKTYVALVDGKPPTPQGRIDAPIGRDLSNRKLMAVVPLNYGRSAITDFSTAETFRDHSLLYAYPLTGRTHQIRVHLAYIGCPIAGDVLYGRKHKSIELDRHFLHAAKLSLVLPGESEVKTFETPLPDELKNILDYLRKK
jgi:23S rRNA pseudouridine1911/1915/1917 synthase